MASKCGIGLQVLYCGHNGQFIADAIEVADAIVVRAPGPVTMTNLQRPATNVTHHLTESFARQFWRPDLGVFVVPKKNFRSLKGAKGMKGGGE